VVADRQTGGIDLGPGNSVSVLLLNQDGRVLVQKEHS
jgi:hypothetical protein